MVILDMTMPDMGGSEAYDRLKVIKADVKVLLSSGYSVDGQAQEILDRGCNGFIQKPFGIKQLSRWLRAILDKKQAHNTSLRSPQKSEALRPKVGAFKCIFRKCWQRHYGRYPYQ
jgi:DNA-binding NtrC family response regulator